MKNYRKLTGLLALGVLSPGISQAFVLPNSDYVTYGDGNSYSLPILQLKDGCVGPGCDFYVNSTPGAIKDLIVVATGASGNPVTTNSNGMDKAYETPSGVSGSNWYTTTNSANDPGISGGTINNNYDTTWDASLSALNTFLGGDEMVFFFNNNNVNNLGSAGQSLAIWAQIWVTDASNNIVGDVYEFTNDNSPYDLISQGGGGVFQGDPANYTSNVANPLAHNPDVGTNANTDYVVSGGQICLTATFIPVECGSPGDAQGPINHNLGANEAAYAVVFPELNDLLEGLFGNLTANMLEDYTLHGDFRLGCDPGFSSDPDAEICDGELHGLGKNINNGFEQIFIGTAEVQRQVPEPGILSLLGLGLAGLGLSGFRRK